MWKYFLVGYQNAQMFLFKLFPCDGSLSSHLLYWYLLALKRDFIVLLHFDVIDGWGLCRWQYHNIYHLVQELGIEWPFTEWTMSSFYSPQGIQVESPVFSALPRLPTPLGSFLYTSPYFRSLLKCIHALIPTLVFPLCIQGQ
jgi:hypothetical protein